MNNLKEKNIILIDENLPYSLNGINYSVGGASVQTQNWMLGFDLNGYNSIVVSSACIKNKSSYIIESSPKIKGFSRPFSLLKVSFFFLKVLRKYRPKFVYLSIPYWSNFVFILPAKFLGIKIIQRISNDNLVLSRAREKFNIAKFFLYKFSLKFSSIILCQNDYQNEIFKSDFPKKIIFKIHNPFLYKYHKIINKRKYIAWLGLFQYQKNLLALYEIAKKLPQINFKIAGEPYKKVDNETTIALNFLKKLKNVEFIGLLPRDNISEFLAHAYCLLNTSRYEGFSNTYLESFSVGTPVVTRCETDPDGIIKKYNLGFSEELYENLPKVINYAIDMKCDFNRIQQYFVEYHCPKSLANELLKKIN